MRSNVLRRKACVRVAFEDAFERFYEFVDFYLHVLRAFERLTYFSCTVSIFPEIFLTTHAIYYLTTLVDKSLRLLPI